MIQFTCSYEENWYTRMNGGLQMNTIDPHDRAVCMSEGDDMIAFHGAVAPPLFQNSLFSFPTIQALHSALDDEKNNIIYTRGNNPTTMLAEKKLAALERAESSKVFASGMAAISSVLFTLCNSGSHVLCLNSIYGPTVKYLTYLKKFGIEFSMITDVNYESIISSIRPNTSVIYCESPGTMTFRVLDLEMISSIARQRGILTVIDNTWATPLFQKPLLHGFDIVVHSCTKYIGGHSDIVAGVVAGKKQIIERVFDDAFMQHGAVLGPFESLLLLRGLRSLPERMLRHQFNALAIVEYLHSHPKVNRVFYPGSLDDPDHRISKKYLTGYSGLLSFDIITKSYEVLAAAVNSCRHFKIGVSWGGYESLIFLPYNDRNGDQLRAKGIPYGLVRISIGLEDSAVLIDDLERMLSLI